MHKQTFYLFINKEKDTWRTQLHEGTPTMAPKNMCKQARVIDTSQIQSKTEQPDIRGNLGSKMGLIRKRAKISFFELEFKNQYNFNKISQP